MKRLDLELGCGTLIGHHNKWTRTAWDASRVIAAPVEVDEDA